MDRVTLDEYKDYLVNVFKHEYDNKEHEMSNRKNILNDKFKNDYLETIISGTYNFVNKIMKLSEDNYYGYLKIHLENEPAIIYITLDLIGGGMSDTVVKDSDNNFYSIGLLREILGPFFFIEPCKIELTEEVSEDDGFTIVSEIPSYYLYIQCNKDIIDNVRKQFLGNKSKIKKL